MTGFAPLIPKLEFATQSALEAMKIAKKSWATDSSPNLKWFANLPENINYQVSHYAIEVCALIYSCDIKSYCLPT